MLREGLILMLCVVFNHFQCTINIDWNENGITLQLHPCAFNYLCTCTSSVTNLGVVRCTNNPLTTLPNFNDSKVFALTLENNGLRILDENCFRNTDMWKLQIRHNFITRIPDDTFAGLEYSLRQLCLDNNRLHFVPQQALRNLVRLQTLDLTGNFILKLENKDFSDLGRSLTHLIIRKNAVTEIARNTFENFTTMEFLDVSDNRLTSLSTTSFLDTIIITRLQKLIITNNALQVIPYGILTQTRSLTSVDLTGNKITSIIESNDNHNDFYSVLLKINGALVVDSVILGENEIKVLQARSFRHFETIRHLSLRGNPLHTITDNAFQGTTIRELDLHGCHLINLMPNAFDGLFTTLHVLNLASNFLDGSVIGASVTSMTYLVSISLHDNKLSHFPLEKLLNSSQTIQEVHLESTERKPKLYGLQIEDFAVLASFRQLQSFGLSHFPSQSLPGNVFRNISPTVDHITLTGSNLHSLTSDSFQHTPTLKHLDLSFNVLEHLDDNVFKNVGRSLKTLQMFNSLHPDVAFLGPEIFTHLSNLRELDLSNNQLKSISSKMFKNTKLLKYLNLQDNFLKDLPDGIFHSEHLPSLVKLKLSFNRISYLSSQTFAHLQKLKYLHLEDNAITVLDKETFVDLNELKVLSLEGNSITTITKETFQVLPKLRHLNLAYNKLETFPMEAFDHVGTLTILEIDASHNQIQHLQSNTSTDNSIVSIKIIDFTYNNISSINSTYFDPVRNSLITIYLGHNNLVDITSNVFGNMPHLQLLELRYNKIKTADKTSFEKSTSLRIILLNNNNLSDLPEELFSQQTSLKHLDLHDNKLTFLADNLLHQTKLEYLNLSSNRLTHFPLNALMQVFSHLRHLDLSRNDIEFLPQSELSMFANLHTLKLSRNNLKTIRDTTFQKLNKLTVLEMSNNRLDEVTHSLESANNSTLDHLDLSDIRLTSMPFLNHPNLLILNLSYNHIQQLIPPTFWTNLKQLRCLDLSHNRLTSLPFGVWSTVPFLKSLKLAFNNIRVVKNDSFVGLGYLDDIDIRGLNETIEIQNGIFLPLTHLRTLYTSTYIKTNNIKATFDLAESLSVISNLQNLHISSEDIKESNLQMSPSSVHHHQFSLRSKNTTASLPSTVTSITISGHGFTDLPEDFLECIENRRIHLKIFDTKISSIRLKGHNERTKYLHLDVSYNDLTVLTVPTTTENLVERHGTFLKELTMLGNRWHCNCDIVWIRHWMKKWRTETPEEQKYFIRNLRETMCMDKRNKTLLDFLKEDFHCGLNLATSSLVILTFTFSKLFICTIITSIIPLEM